MSLSSPASTLSWSWFLRESPSPSELRSESRAPATRPYAGFRSPLPACCKPFPVWPCSAFLLPVPFIGGIGKHTAILCLILYSLLPILRNTIVGITTVDTPVREAAIAMGMTDAQLLAYGRVAARRARHHCGRTDRARDEYRDRCHRRRHRWRRSRRSDFSRRRLCRHAADPWREPYLPQLSPCSLMPVWDCSSGE